MRRQRLSAFLRLGNASQAAWLFPVLAGPPAILILIVREGDPPAPTLAALAAWCLVAYGLSWLLVAKFASDVLEVEERKRAAAQYELLADRAFLAATPSFESTEEEFAELAEAELHALPGWMQAAIARDNVAIGIADEREGSPRTLGLYQTTGHGRQSEITLYRVPIMRAAGDRSRLRAVVHETLLHELGHLFGMSERDLDDYSIGNRPRPDAEQVHPAPE